LSFRFTNFEIDVARQELRRAGEIVHIEPQVFDLLVHLVRHRDRIVGKDELIDTVWQGRIVSEATLSSRISAARRALGDSGNDQSLIRTLYKRGFRFVGDVDADSAANDSPTLVPADEPRAPAYTSSTMAPASTMVPAATGTAPAPRPALRHLRSAAAVIGLAAVVTAAAWWLVSSPSLSSAPAPHGGMTLAARTASPTDGMRAQVPSIIVLPFANLSGDSKRDYLADGITDSLISDIVRALPGISVVSRDTAFTYKGQGADARQIGRDLGVRYLLEGSVVLEGERVRVNTRLAETAEGRQLWTERFDTELKSILQVQDEIVGRVSRAIGLKVIDIEARRSLRERPDSAELIDLVMRGKAVLNRPSSPATMVEARGLFEQALKVEPTSVDGLAGVAATFVFEFLNGYSGDQRLTQAEMMLERAVMLEPRHLVALKAKAALRRIQGKFEDAITAAQTVIMENPGEPWAYKEIGLSTLYLGRPEPALEWFAKADRIGPRDPGRWTWLDGRGHSLILLGRDEEAVHALIAALEANPKNLSSHGFLAAAYALLDRTDDARAALAAYLQRRPDTRISTFRRFSPVPLVLTSASYQQQHERLKEGLRRAGMPE
jgi:TolB-like protein/DNA-binding winged helix-turn-helix (wHTH) protein